LVLQNGILVKSGATSRRYLGSFRTIANNVIESSSTKRRFLYNYYNKKQFLIHIKDTTDTWTYSTAAFRATNNNTTVGAGRCEILIGVSDELVEASGFATLTSDTTFQLAIGVGIDSTTANSAQRYSFIAVSSAYVSFSSLYLGYPGIGYHYIQNLEHGGGAGVQTWWGDSGSATLHFGGLLIAKIWC